MIKKWHGPGGLWLEFDSDQIFVKDPGQGTPLMVYAKKGRVSGTYWCVSDIGECSCGSEYYNLNKIQLDWLRRVGEKAEELLDKEWEKQEVIQAAW